MGNRLPWASTAEIEQARPPKNVVAFERPYAFFVEDECSRTGVVQPVLTVLLTNRECPLRCLMCDLWRNTRDEPTPRGAIVEQIRWARTHTPAARQVKLYNSGNFFDRLAIPPADHEAIAEEVADYETVIVENHPRFCNAACATFRNRIAGTFEIAMGLETVHPDVLPRLNKAMTLEDFARATERLLASDIAVRAFILLRPPLLTETEGVEWALRSIEYAFSLGIGCCSVIPTRAGNGIMEQWQRNGWFHPPTIASMEQVLETGLRLGRGRVFMDLWDAEQFAPCPHCRADRIERLRQMNLTQRIVAPVTCVQGCEPRPRVQEWP